MGLCTSPRMDADPQPRLVLGSAFFAVLSGG